MAVSAPRSEGGELCTEIRGGVHILDFEYEDNPGLAIYGILRENNTFGSYFGASLVSVDINHDDLDDLIVGAPLECGAESLSRDPGSCADGLEDAGCIYIYSDLVRLHYTSF